MVDTLGGEGGVNSTFYIVLVICSMFFVLTKVGGSLLAENSNEG